MLERFDAAAHAVLNRAGVHARRLGCPEVTGALVVRAVLDDQSTAAGRLLAAQPEAARCARAAIEAMAQPTGSRADRGVCLAAEVRAGLEAAVQANPYGVLGMASVMVSLLARADAPAAVLLATAGMRVDEFRRDLADVVSRGAHDDGPATRTVRVMVAAPTRSNPMPVPVRRAP